MSREIEVHFRFNCQKDDEVSNLISFMLEVSREELTAIVLGGLRTDYRYILCGDMVFVQNPPGHWRGQKAIIYARRGSAKESYQNRHQRLMGSRWRAVRNEA